MYFFNYILSVTIKCMVLSISFRNISKIFPTPALYITPLWPYNRSQLERFKTLDHKHDFYVFKTRCVKKCSEYFSPFLNNFVNRQALVKNFILRDAFKKISTKEASLSWWPYSRTSGFQMRTVYQEYSFQEELLHHLRCRHHHHWVQSKQSCRWMTEPVCSPMYTSKQTFSRNHHLCCNCTFASENHDYCSCFCGNEKDSTGVNVGSEPLLRVYHDFERLKPIWDSFWHHFLNVLFDSIPMNVYI